MSIPRQYKENMSTSDELEFLLHLNEEDLKIILIALCSYTKELERIEKIMHEGQALHGSDLQKIKAKGIIASSLINKLEKNGYFEKCTNSGLMLNWRNWQ